MAEKLFSSVCSLSVKLHFDLSRNVNVLFISVEIDVFSVFLLETEDSRSVSCLKKFSSVVMKSAEGLMDGEPLASSTAPQANGFPHANGFQQANGLPTSNQVRTS